MKKVTAIIVALILCAASFYLGRSCKSGNVIPYSNEVVVDSTTVESTIPDLAPTPRDSVVLRYKYVTIPISQKDKEENNDSCEFRPAPDELVVTENNDTAEVVIPITQKVYETEDYRAYISGFQANMDSIFVKSRTNTIRIREPTKPKSFSIGLQAGYGMTPRGFQPYVGVGVSVNLWSF